MHGPLGQTRGTRRIHYVQLVIVAGPGLGHSRVGLLLQLVVGRGPVGSLVIARLHPGGHRRRVGSPLQRGHHLGKLTVKQQHRGTAVREYEGQLVGHQPPVERHHDGTDAGDGEKRLDVLGAVHHEQRHAVALAYPEIDKRVGRATGALVELAVSEPQTRLHAYESFDIRIQFGPLGKK